MGHDGAASHESESLTARTPVDQPIFLVARTAGRTDPPDGQALRLPCVRFAQRDGAGDGRRYEGSLRSKGDARDTQDSGARIAAVVVCFEPSHQALQSCLQALHAHPDVDVILIDNSETREAQQAVASAARVLPAELIANGENLGVAEAQNQGLRRVHARGLPYALLLDQDSRLSCSRHRRATSALRELTLCGERVAAVGPGFVDARTRRPFPFLRSVAGRVQRVDIDGSENDEPIDCDVLISSGSLLNMAAVAIGRPGQRSVH
jgi:hypothetical protein